MIAPTPPAANLDSQLIRVWVSEPSSLSKRPEMLERNIRFLTVKLRNFNGVKMGSSAIGLPLRGMPNSCQQRPNPSMGRAAAPALRHERHLAARRSGVRQLELQQDEGGVVEVAAA